VLDIGQRRHRPDGQEPGGREQRSSMDDRRHDGGASTIDDIAARPYSSDTATPRLVGASRGDPLTR